MLSGPHHRARQRRFGGGKRVGRGLTQATIEFAEVAKWAWRDPPQVKWFRIVAIDGPRRRAWTNPIWVDGFN